VHERWVFFIAFTAWVMFPIVIGLIVLYSK
jgi:hypothetical protein